ncbi:hypothetical protein BSZ39_04730 [Bowdeniella nasicola]|uniref:non-specific serine/threonine protein kinase n=1 Tax=Bowdeniella nasicola TaxID=208480 RepID=A0A1Q5Q3D0_9ACTO|nr:hypothetical protein BSZ39_04730 [Bowdeniella nasicola]
MLAGRYEIGELIGRGGMAEVHIGYDTRLSRRVAIKLLREELARDPVFLARFRREAQSSAALNNSTIVGVYDTGEEEVISPRNGEKVSLPYIIMEYVEGHTVRDLLKDGTAVPINEAVEIVNSVLIALEYAHRAGIVHRDIKPGNVMLTPQGDVKVMDFGIARAMADSQATMTQANAVVGTAQYLSPEQARGEVVDARSDLYSTGCLLFELLTGQPPFTGDSAVAIAYQHVRETPRTPSSVASDIPEALDRVVLKSLAKDREQRYADADAMRKDLLAAVRGGTVSAPSTAVWGVAGGIAPGATTAMATPVQRDTQMLPPEPATSTQPALRTEEKKNSKGWLWGLLAFLVVTLGVVAAYLAMNGNKEPEVEMVKVPVMTDLNQAGVRNALSQAGLEINIGDEVADDKIPVGIFVSSDPAPGEEVKKGSTVTVHFSSGPGVVTVPDVRGQSQEQAIKVLEKAGLKVSSVKQEDAPRKEQDVVLSTNPENGAKVAKNAAIELTVASGYVNVPDLKGKTLQEATKIINEELGLSVTTTEQESGDYEPGTVLQQDRSGKVEVGTTIALTIAKEARDVIVPTTPTPTDSVTPNPTGTPSKGKEIPSPPGEDRS